MNARRRINKSDVAKQSLADISSFLAREAGLEVALRFLTNAEEAFAVILQSPGIGQLQEFRSLELENVRAWYVHGFENWIVYYREVERSVEVLDVMHAARDREVRLEEKLREDSRD